MSYAGLASDLYTQIREYAELLDQVILDFKAGAPDAHKDSRIQLGQLLASTGDYSRSDLRIQLLASLLRVPGQPTSSRLPDIGHAIQEGRTTPSLMKDLESLAQ